MSLTGKQEEGSPHLQSVSSYLLHSSTRTQPEPLFFTMRACFWGMWDLISKRISGVDGCSCHPEALTLLKSNGQISFLMALPPLAPLKCKTCTCYLLDRNWQRFYGMSSLDDHEMMRLMVKSRFQSWVGLVCVHLWSETSPRPLRSPHWKANENSLIWVEDVAAWIWGLAGF